jgi:NADH-quinone oxidoreductase subunit F
VHVCEDLACVVNGADTVRADLERHHGPAGTPTADGRATWHLSPCLGMCERAPVALCIAAGSVPQEEAYAPTTAADLLNLLRSASFRTPRTTMIPQAGDPHLRLLRRIGRADPTHLDDYRAHSGYVALRQAIQLGPEQAIREITEAKLLGKGSIPYRPKVGSGRPCRRAPALPGVQR